MELIALCTLWGYYLKKTVFVFIFCLLMSRLADAEQEFVCGSIDVRNDVTNFNQLENCTVIEGHLDIVLIDYAEWSDYQDISFPKLREITDYFLLYRVFGLKSLSHIFPNLTVIRGQRLFYNYALVMFEVPMIEDIGLVGLTVIERGAVRLEKNWALCYIDTINWQRITSVKDEDHFIVANKDTDDCINVCPPNSPSHVQFTSDGGEKRQPLCWNFNFAQKMCVPDCGRRGCYTTKGSRGETVSHCCAESCLGGCYGPRDDQCIACQKFIYKGRCEPRCPAGTYEYHQRRCITENECRSLKNRQGALNYKLLSTEEGQKCESECPSGYIQDEDEAYLCAKCDGSCPKVCPALTIHSVSAAQNLRGCTVINGILEIQIRGGSQVEVELERSLGNIQEIRQYITIRQSNALTSINFLKSLTLIRGDYLMSKRYALFVLDNHNLQDIWDLEHHPKLVIEKGKVFFHFNPKLCMNKIDEFVQSVGLENQTDTTDISRQTNGDQAACNITTLRLEFTKIADKFAIIRWSNFNTADHRELLSWVVNYREASERNVTIFNARDACGTDVWKTMDVDPDVDPNASFVATVLHDLEPFTQYAVYVQTYTISSATRGAITNIGYFKTLPDVPTHPRDIKVEARRPGELYMSWKPPSKPNGNVSHYMVYWYPVSLNPKQFEVRDYCKNRLQNYKNVKEEPEAKNKTFADGECCACPKTTKQQRIDEEERKFQIHFENYLQNEVYRINPVSGASDSSYKKKKKRAAPQLGMETTTRIPLPVRGLMPGAGSGSVMNPLNPNMTSILNNAILPPINDTNIWVPAPDEEEDYSSAVVNRKTEIVLPDLHHFQEYSIEIIACHEYEEGLKEKHCSNRAITSARTQPSPTADTIDHRNITTENVTHINHTNYIHIRWPEPPQPNGLIVAYDLEMNRIGIKNLKPDKFCITHSDYRKKGGSDTANLAPGNWSFKIRATSLAGYGPWTPELYFYVANIETTETFPVGLVAGVVMVGVGLIVVVAIGLACYINRKRGIPNHNGLYASINPDYLGVKEVYIPDEWEIDRDKVELLKELGQGSFGMVYEGIAKGIDEAQPKLKVAVKTVNVNASIKDRIEFLNEASVMKAFNCHHVVKLLCVVSKGQPTLVIMELMSNGDLKTFLRLHRPDYEGNDGRKPPSLKQIIQMAGEIADGMAYLTEKKYVHRDLAARNCMVAEDNTVKIGDFGMTRDIYETDYYRKGGKGLLPVRWMAPESLRDGMFSSQSDVWSYGVVLWEMSTLAAQPYQGFANEQVLKFVVDGNIMEKPENCPDLLYKMMVNCWKYTARQRPTFLEIIEELVPELDPSFRDKSFFFSDLNTDAADEGGDNLEEEEGEASGVATPLTGSPLRNTRIQLHQPRDAIATSGDEEENEENIEFHRRHPEGNEDDDDLKSSHSTLSYESHSLRHSPPPPQSSLQNNNQNCSRGMPLRRCQQNADVGGTHEGSALTGEPYNVIKLNNSKATTGSNGSKNYSESGASSSQKWSPDSNPPGVPQSNEGSKSSSKSGNSNGMNGIANGHIPRLVMSDTSC